MSLDSKLESNFIDTQYSSGDTNEMKSKQIYQEENNNNIDELTKNLEMGCIVNKIKRPPNICVETCVYESDSDISDKKSDNCDDPHYSDEFEEDNSDEEIKIISKSASNMMKSDLREPSLKMSKSHSSMASKQPSLSTKSGRSSNVGSVSRQLNRVNMSFSNERLREIERHNHILLNKILGARNKQSSIPAREQPVRRPVPSAAVQRKNKQKQIDHDNMILLKKIQRAKSSAYSVRR